MTKYAELSDTDKAKARDWLRGLTFTDSSDWEHIYEDADQVAALMGITIHTRPFKTVGGATRTEPNIFFSGFSSQGDGASFEGRYRYKADAVEAVIGYASRDAELHRIAQALEDVQATYGVKLRATVTVSGHYVHSGCMDVEVENDDGEEVDDETEIAVRDALRSFADWIYRQLEAEYEYQTSDEQLEEAIEANDYDFDVARPGTVRL